MAPRRGAVLRSAIVRRVSVVGTSGSGKSTLARQLAAVLGVPYLELDGLNHQPGWQPLPPEEFRQAVAVRAAEDGWVIDGNYSTIQPPTRTCGSSGWPPGRRSAAFWTRRGSGRARPLGR